MNERIIFIREKLILNKKDFANYLNVSSSLIVAYENGSAEPTPKFLSKLKSTFNVNPVWVVNGTGEMFLNGGPSTPGVQKGDLQDPETAKLLSHIKSLYEDEIDRLRLENDRLWKLLSTSSLGKLLASDFYPIILKKVV